MSLRAFVYRKGEINEISPDEYRQHDGYSKWFSAFRPEKAELEWIFATFSPHPLVIEDIQTKNDPPKVDEYAGYTFIITDIPAVEEGQIVIYKLFLILGKDFVVSITDYWDIVRKRETSLINRHEGLDERGPDYLAYTFIDHATDMFYPALDRIEDDLADLEEMVITKVDKQMLSRMADTRRGLLTLRKSAWRVRDVIMEMSRGSSALITPATLIYIRDIYDHVTQVMDLIETYRDILASSRDIYMSAVSLSLNRIMKQLTIIATIMLPLTFIVGVYGMNFKYMPELYWEYGYYAVWAIIILLTAGMLIYFRLNKWI